MQKKKKKSAFFPQLFIFSSLVLLAAETNLTQFQAYSDTSDLSPLKFPYSEIPKLF